MSIIHIEDSNIAITNIPHLIFAHIKSNKLFLDY